MSLVLSAQTIARPTFRPQELIWAAWWVCVLVAFIALRGKTSHPVVNGDELIPIAVSETMTRQGVLDPNWHLAFSFDTYNFYLYNIVAHGLIQIGGWFDYPALVVLRRANLVFQLAAFAFALDALHRIGASRLVLAVAGALIAVAPGLVQDAGMARPESFIYLLSALFVWVLTLPLSERYRMVLTGLVLGAGAGVKVTFLGLVVLLPFVVAVRGRPVRDLAVSVACVSLGAVAGFATAAPYALINIDIFLNGLADLQRQYGTGSPPHSPPAYHLAGQILWMLRYYVELYGPLLIVAFASPLLLKGPARYWAAGFVAAFLLLFAYFATKPLFLERNFSHALIPLFLAAALGVGALDHRSFRIAAVGLMLLPMAYWSAEIAIQTRRMNRVANFESARGLQPMRFKNHNPVVAGELPGNCVTFAHYDYNDPWTPPYLAKLQDNGFELIAHYRGRFRSLVTSTLHTYLDADIHTFRCPQRR